MTCKRSSGFTMIEFAIAAAILALVFALAASVHRERTVEMPATYAAWVKMSGNPHELTYDEWVLLMKANERQKDSTVIFMPMNTGSE